MDRRPMTLDEINRMSALEFVAAFGAIAEHSPWVAERAAHRRPFSSRDAMIAAFSEAVRLAIHDDKLALIRAHPDLASRARLTLDSSKEQKGAGLDSLNEAEFARFIDLNRRYKKAFGFPFIFAVKGATKQQILASFEERIRHSPQAEFETAIANVCRILKFRIEDRVAP
jgi:2-oxo-4-hydroxy-4-carboxy-5-ureidoimidazoline decarboxylase